jgi:hypothetical protein
LLEVRERGDFAVPFVNLVKDPNGVLIRSDRFIQSPSIGERGPRLWLALPSLWWSPSSRLIRTAA